MENNESEHDTMFGADTIAQAIETMSEAIYGHISDDPPDKVALIGIQAGGVPSPKGFHAASGTVSAGTSTSARSTSRCTATTSANARRCR